MNRAVAVALLFAVISPPMIKPAAQSDSWTKHIKAAKEARKNWRYKDALKRLRSALVEAEQPGFPEAQLAETLKMLGVTLRDLGKYQEAEQTLIRALNIEIKIKAPTASILHTFMLLANVYAVANYVKGELAWLEKALDHARTSLGPESTFEGLVLSEMAAAYCKVEEYDKAEPLYLRAIAIYEKAPKPKYWNAANILRGYIEMLKKTDRKAELKVAKQRLKLIEANK